MALKITDLKHSLPLEVKTFMLADVKGYNNYVNGERSNVLGGYTYDLVLPEMKYERLSVKIPLENQSKPLVDIINKEEIPVGMPVRLEGLEIRAYNSKSGINITALAKSISLVTSPVKGA
ncbi:hypothetical protein [Aminipila sp.]|uniref:hypothetical protein n=1 Tax=Aminipila sp. TaxID=2060095 RepID=UPI0028A29DC9|nr:hypothetical protein [Aminipila sp.]